MQQVFRDKEGVVRFKKNVLVAYLVDTHKLSLNDPHLYTLANDNPDDYAQLMQLIGYSICGYDELSMVPDNSKRAAWRMYQKLFKASKKERVER